MAADASLLSGPTSTGVDPRVSALLAYSAWWLSGVIFLIIEREHDAVRFHAAQSVVLFGALSVVVGLLAAFSVGMLVVSAAAFEAMRLTVYLVWIGAVVLWLLLLRRTLRGESWRLPVVARLAEMLASR